MEGQPSRRGSCPIILRSDQIKSLYHTGSRDSDASCHSVVISYEHTHRAKFLFPKLLLAQLCWIPRPSISLTRLIEWFILNKSWSQLISFLKNKPHQVSPKAFMLSRSGAHRTANHGSRPPRYLGEQRWHGDEGSAFVSWAYGCKNQCRKKNKTLFPVPLK